MRGDNSKRNLILNASPLIYFSKIGLSKIFSEFKEEKYTTPLVIDEVVGRGKNDGYPDAFIVEKLVDDGILKIKSPKNKTFITYITQIPELHAAEVEVLALTKELNGIAILDDGDARQVAKIFNIEAHGSAYLLLRLNYRGVLSKQEAKDAIDNMVAVGWRLSLEDYARIVSVLK
ncbi:MAG: hypothetical protein ACTSRS_20180 [Candidatus Helarchaeota archaeon]